jgi:hypothetical protein
MSAPLATVRAPEPEKHEEYQAFTGHMQICTQSYRFLRRLLTHTRR